MFYKCLLVLVGVLFVHGDYWMDRRKFILDEHRLGVGGKMQLSAKEKVVNSILMAFKSEEIEEGFKNPRNFPPATHFFRAKKELEKSNVYAIIRKMPKGGLLHAHDSALMTPEWFVKNITYRNNLYMCTKNGTLTFLFSESQPIDACWKTVKEMREDYEDKEKFDDWLKQHFTLKVENPEETYLDVHGIWKTFSKIFIAITSMLSYPPVFEAYFYAALQSLYDDNIQFLEMRSSVHPLYHLNGSQIPPVKRAELMREVVKKFKKDHPDFAGVKLIFAPYRKVNQTVMDEHLKKFAKLQNAHPGFVVGFDLVGQEDVGRPLSDFVQKLKANNTRYFFHAGETNWFGTSVDLNLVDAVMLNATRIGHGYALTKHLKVVEQVINRNIAVELNPISNQVLMLVKDLRNHPASLLLAGNCPVVIASDDPGFWDADGLSHDFYMAFMGMASAMADIRMLKQLAINSIKYSDLNETEKKEVSLIFNERWEKFLVEIIKDYPEKAKMYPY